MAAYGWVFYYGSPSSTVFTNEVLSFNAFTGRQNYNDNYAGGYFNITIKNDSNQIANFPRGTVVQIDFNNGNTALYGYVSNVDFNDYPGNIGLSTATITCIDEIARAGKWQLKEFPLYAESPTIEQAKQTNIGITGWDTPEVLEIFDTGQSTASGVASYTGTILNRLNLLVQTEKGMLQARSAGIYFYSRKDIVNGPTTVSLTPSTISTTTIAYDTFKRTAAGENFYNQVTVQPQTVTEQQAENIVSQTANGVSGYAISTVDATTTQALGLADWLANMQGDPNTLRFEVTFTDVGNDATAFRTLLKSLRVFNTNMISLSWQAQGQSLKTGLTICEGIGFSGTPAQTTITLYLSPIEYYNYFILDSEYLGVLGGGGIVYNQPEITYDEAGWVYNDSNADDTASRLGW
jgi:hypothetical protein